ncbi:MAG: hydantoin utilization protein A [Planctomycetota bacterium]
MIVQGLLAGAAHVMTGPDHLAGVAPLAVGAPRRLRPSAIGALWGLGHGLGVALLGLLGQTALSFTDVEIASGWAERLVGVVLIVIGLTALRRARGLVVHDHAHSHGEGEHVHLHVHHPEHRHDGDAHGPAAPPHGHRHAAFGVGVLHGLAGAGHFWAVIPSLAMAPPDAAVFIGSYLAASVAIMTGFGGAIGWLVRSCGDRAVPRLMVAVGTVSIVVGIAWLVSC